MLRKKLIITAIIAAMAVSAVSCGNTESSSTSESSAAATTAAEETTTAEETTAEETTEAASEAETTTAAETTAAEASTGEVPTNKELLRAVIEGFNIISDGSFEDDVKKAKSWHVINDDEELDPDADATPEFLVSSCVRAGSFADGSASMDEIISIAIEKGFITDSDLSKVDMTKTAEFIKNAAYAWSHQTFDNDISVTLADGVVDLNGVITADDWTMNGDVIELSEEAAKDIKSGTVFILPKKSTGEGGAYKATAVVTTTGKVQISATPAEVADVYGSIN